MSSFFSRGRFFAASFSSSLSRIRRRGGRIVVVVVVVATTAAATTIVVTTPATTTRGFSSFSPLFLANFFSDFLAILFLLPFLLRAFAFFLLSRFFLLSSFPLVHFSSYLLSPHRIARDIFSGLYLALFHRQQWIVVHFIPLLDSLFRVVHIRREIFRPPFRSFRRQVLSSFSFSFQLFRFFLSFCSSKFRIF